MDYLTLLAGAAIALGSAFLGIVSEAAKSWMTRRTSIEDRKIAFQHRTAVELQETLYEAGLRQDRIFYWYALKHKSTGKWGDPSLPPEEEGQKDRHPRAQALMLAERLDDDQVRQSVSRFLELGPEMLTAESFEEALWKKDELDQASDAVNKALGKIIRDSWPE